MNDLIINVEKSTRMVLMTKTTVGNDMENLQEKLVFKFTDTFVNGQGRLEYKIGTDKNYIVLTKEDNTYTIPVQNVITKEGRIEMQLVITEGTEETNVPVFKSNVFYLYCNRSLNAVNEAPEGYDLWIEQANAKLNAMDEALAEVDNLDIDVSKSGNTATVSITNKEGITKSVEIYDGQTGAVGPQGVAGNDAKINGVNTLNIEAGKNIKIVQQDDTLTISSTGGGSGGSSDYTDLTNKPKINNVELKGNKSLNDLGIQPAGNYLTSETDPTVPNHVKNITQSNITSWNNKSDFSGDYNDLTNKPTIPTIPTNVSAFTNDAGYLTQHQDISGKADKISVVQSSASTIEINSNTFYKFGEVASLNITLASITDNTIYNEYMFEFVSGSTATTLTLPSSIKWLKTPTIDANKIYQCSIVDNVGLLVGVANV